MRVAAEKRLRARLLDRKRSRGPQITVRVTHNMLNFVQARADALDLSVAEWLRKLIAKSMCRLGNKETA